MVSSTGRKIISLAISLLVVVISLTGVALGATAPTVASLTSGPNGNGRYTPGFAGAPGKMARDAAGNFYVADFWAKGIVKLDRQLSKIGFIPTLGRPSAVAALPDNRLVVAMTAPQPYVAFYSQLGSAPDVSGEETGTFENPAPTLYRPSGITVDHNGYIYVLDAGDSSIDMVNNVGKIRVYGPNNGTYRYAIGTRTLTYQLATVLDTRLKQPAGIAYEKVGHKIVVADTLNGRLLFFSEYDGNSMGTSAASFIGKSAGSGNGTDPPPSLGLTTVTFGNPVDVAFEYDAVPTLSRIYVAERARNEISVLDATTNKSTKYINGTTVSGATLKFPNSLHFEKTASGGVLYVSNSATSSPADILSLSIDNGAIPGTGATLTIDAVDPTSTSPSIAISGTNSGAFAVSCSVNSDNVGAFVAASGTTSWTISSLGLVLGNNHILCKTFDGTVTSFAQASTNYNPAPVAGPTPTITAPLTGSYTNNVSQAVSGTTTVGNASVRVDGDISGTCTTTSNVNGNWNCTLTLPEGINLLTASAWKVGTTVNTANATVVVDLTDPDMTVTGKISFVSDVDTEVGAPTTTNAVQNLDGIVFDANLSSVEVNGVAVPAEAKVTLSGTNTYFSTPVTLSRGLNTITVMATDLAGRSTTLSRKVTLDPEKPGLTVALPADNSYSTTTTATASGTVNTAFTSVNAAGTAVIPAGGNWSTAAMTVASDVFGSYKFTASGGGNATVTEKRTINSGAAYAQLAITSPAADRATKDSSVVITGSVAAGTVAAPTISVNGGATISGSTYTQGTGVFSHTVTFPAQGTYSVKVAANAATAAIRNIIYDANIPELTIQADSKPMPATITGSIEPSVRISAITASLGGFPVVIPLSVITFDPQASGSVVWHANLSGYAYDTITFTAANPAGNEKPLARKTGIPTGDIDGDGTVRLSDALAALRHVAGTESLVPAPTKFFQADVGSLVEGHAGQDDVVDITDAVLILNKSYGLLSF